MTPDLAEFVGYFMGRRFAARARACGSAVSQDDPDVRDRLVALRASSSSTSRPPSPQKTGSLEVAVALGCRSRCGGRRCGFAKLHPSTGRAREEATSSHVPDAILARTIRQSTRASFAASSKPTERLTRRRPTSLRPTKASSTTCGPCCSRSAFRRVLGRHHRLERLPISTCCVSAMQLYARRVPRAGRVHRRAEARCDAASAKPGKAPRAIASSSANTCCARSFRVRANSIRARTLYRYRHATAPHQPHDGRRAPGAHRQRRAQERARVLLRRRRGERGRRRAVHLRPLRSGQRHLLSPTASSRTTRSVSLWTAIRPGSNPTSRL